MSAKQTGRTVRCDKTDARSRLDVAEVADNPDVIATNAIHAAIAAADVLCCLKLGERSRSTNHAEGVDLLRRVDARAANALKRCLDLKTKAAYETLDLSARDATGTVRHARSLVEEAMQALIATA